MLKGSLIIGQSGGPSPVINSSAYGVIRTALDAECIPRRSTAHTTASRAFWTISFCAWIKKTAQSSTACPIRLLPRSAPAAIRLPTPDVDDTDYKRILEIFKKYDVRYFCYNGGNDSMDTCNKISKYEEGRLRVPRHGRTQDHRQ